MEIFYYWFILPQYSSVCPTNFLTFFCLGLQQIRDHFYYINGGHLYSKSGLGFAVTLSIKKLENLWVTRRLQSTGRSIPIPKESWFCVLGPFCDFGIYSFWKRNRYQQELICYEVLNFYGIVFSSILTVRFWTSNNWYQTKINTLYMD